MSMFWRAILLGILKRRAPDVSIGQIRQLDRFADPQFAMELRDIVGSEIADFGITDGEINEWGILCDELIDQIGPLPD
jgi:hypothetical protein